MTEPPEANTPRRLWQLLEPYYTLLSAPERKQILTAAGLKGGWMTYFATRAAPLGPVPPEIVTRAFHVFSPTLVHRAIPDAWQLVDTDTILRLRLEVIDKVARRRLDPWLRSTELSEAADLAAEAAGYCDRGGRPLFTANARLPFPHEPHLKLWHAANLIREHRGDGHMATLVSHGLDGVEACVTHAAAIPQERKYQMHYRGWSESEWSFAEERLRQAEWLTKYGALTEKGSDMRARIEDLTDLHATKPWTKLGDEKTTRLVRLLTPITSPPVDADPRSS